MTPRDEFERIAAEVVSRVLGAMAATQEGASPVQEELPGVLQVECVRAGWRARGERDKSEVDKLRFVAQDREDYITDDVLDLCTAAIRELDE